MPFEIPRAPSRAVDGNADRLTLLQPTGFSHPDILFVIRRTNNDNMCVYQLNRRADQTLNQREPVLVYWVDRHKRAWKRAGLNFAERTFGYGIDLKGPVQEKQCKFAIRALPNNIVTARLKPDRSRAFTHLNDDEWCEIHSIDVSVAGISIWNVLKPSDWVRWIGVNAYNKHGDLCYERFNNKD